MGEEPDNRAVLTWYDQSGNGFHVEQSIAARQRIKAMGEEPDNRVVLTWQKTALCRRNIRLLVRSAKHEPFTEIAAPALVLRHPGIEGSGSFCGQVWKRRDAKRNEGRYLVTCQWRGETMWAFAKSAKSAAGLGGDWLLTFMNFSDRYRIETP